MNEMIEIELVRALVHESIQRCATRKYPDHSTQVHAFMEIFENKLQRELALIRQKTTQPLLDTVLTEEHTDDIKEPS
jgi:hypothetical protein